MKFDVVIGNPPYKGNGYLYLKILKEVLTWSENIVWLCPSNWTDKIEPQYKIENELRKNTKLKSFTDLGNPWPELEGQLNNVTLYHFNKNGKIVTDEIYKRLYNNWNLTESIIQKFSSYKNKIIDFSCVKNKTIHKYKFLCGTTNRSVNSPLDPNFYTIFYNCKTKITEKEPYKNWYHFWNFNTKIECENFISYCNSIIVKYALKLKKHNFHFNENMKLIPMLSSYKNCWTDEMICDELNISTEEYKYICEEMKPYM